MHKHMVTALHNIEHQHTYTYNHYTRPCSVGAGNDKDASEGCAMQSVEPNRCFSRM